MSAIDTTHPIARFGNQDGSMNLVSFLDMVLVNKKFKKINMHFYAQSQLTLYHLTQISNTAISPTHLELCIPSFLLHCVF